MVGFTLRRLVFRGEPSDPLSLPLFGEFTAFVALESTYVILYCLLFLELGSGETSVGPIPSRLIQRLERRAERIE
jgi:hypothetical protein